MATEYEGQQFDDTLPLTGLMTGASVHILQPMYALSEVEYIHLMSGAGWPAIWALNLAVAVVGYALGLSPKVLPTWKGEAGAMQTSEWMPVAGGAVVVLLLLLLGLRFRPKRAAVIAKINSCFKAPSKTTLFVRGK